LGRVRFIELETILYEKNEKNDSYHRVEEHRDISRDEKKSIHEKKEINLDMEHQL
jgi:hypothetical protein